MIRRLLQSEAHTLSAAQAIADLAAAVKELAENALDAGASALTVTMRNSGLDGIEVADDGCGIGPADLALLGRKGHTSKIAHDSDILRVESYGFRGEALHSLAVLSSRVVVRSRLRSEKACGFEVVLSSQSTGTLVNVTANPGTVVSVSGLLATFPVRRGEWERSQSRALSKALAVLQALAVARPGVRFRVVHFRTAAAKPEVLLASLGLGDAHAAFAEAYASTSMLADVARVVSWGGCATSLRLLHSREAARRAADRQVVVFAGRPVDMPRLMRRLNEAWRRARDGLRRDGQAGDSGLFPCLLVYIDPDRAATGKNHILDHCDSPGNSSTATKSPFQNHSGTITENLNAFLDDDASSTMSKSPILNIQSFAAEKPVLQEGTQRRRAGPMADVNFAPDKRQVLLEDEAVLVDAFVAMLEQSLAESAPVCAVPGTQAVLSQAPGVLDVSRPALPIPRAQLLLQLPLSSMTLIGSQRAGGGVSEKRYNVHEPHSPSSHQSASLPESLDLESDSSSPCVDGSAPRGSMVTGSSSNNLNERFDAGQAKHNGIGESARTIAPTNGCADHECFSLNACGHENVDDCIVDEAHECGNLEKHSCLDGEGTPDAGGLCGAAESALADVHLERADFARMRIVGQFNRGFVIATLAAASGVERVFIIDQHASDERFRLEALERGMRHGVQPLVVPVRIDSLLSPSDVLFVRDSVDRLAELGFGISVSYCDVSTETIAMPCTQSTRLYMTTVPALGDALGTNAPVLCAEDLCEAVALLQRGELRGLHSLRRVAAVLASRACRSAIMIGDALTVEEMARVVRNLAGVERPWICAHGRPTVRLLLERMSI